MGNAVSNARETGAPLLRLRIRSDRRRTRRLGRRRRLQNNSRPRGLQEQQQRRRGVGVAQAAGEFDPRQLAEIQLLSRVAVESRSMLVLACTRLQRHVRGPVQLPSESAAVQEERRQPPAAQHSPLRVPGVQTRGPSPAARVGSELAPLLVSVSV